jgi:hypothetical protein
MTEGASDAFFEERKEETEEPLEEVQQDIHNSGHAKRGHSYRSC